MFGRAFLMKNHGQNVNELINRFTHIINTKKVLADVIMTEIGDIFKQSLCYIDTKRDRDIVKVLFAQATSASFVAKLQGVSNKTSIMNARDELRENINRYSDIIETSKLVRNDINEQQNRLTKRVIEKRKQKEIRLPEQYDSRGQYIASSATKVCCG
jgi:4-hydroxyphenylpyruvate dioxygenase-like putative hemolysin